MTPAADIAFISCVAVLLVAHLAHYVFFLFRFLGLAKTFTPRLILVCRRPIAGNYLRCGHFQEPLDLPVRRCSQNICPLNSLVHPLALAQEICGILYRAFSPELSSEKHLHVPHAPRTSFFLSLESAPYGMFRFAVCLAASFP